MDRDQIIQLVTDYSNRTDTETLNLIPSFMVLAEARINRDIRTYNMTAEIAIDPIFDINGDVQKAYPIDVDSRGLREIDYIDPGGGRHTLHYVAPARFNAMALNQAQAPAPSTYYYTIRNNELIFLPYLIENSRVLIVAYMLVPALTDSNTTNWISELHPDLYLYATLAELNRFVKNPIEAQANLDILSGIYTEVQESTEYDRWFGNKMEIKSDSTIGQSGVNQGRGGV